MPSSMVRRARWRVGAVLSAALLGAGAAVAVIGTPVSGATAALPITGATQIAQVTQPQGVAASGGDVYVTNPYFTTTQVVTVLGGTSYAIPPFHKTAFCAAHPTFTCAFTTFRVEPYIAVAPGTATSAFPGGEVYITQGPNVYEMAAGGGALTLFATVPGLFTGVHRNPALSGGQKVFRPEYATGITFDTVGTYTHDMILTATNGTAWKVAATGTATELGTVGTYTRTGHHSTTVMEGPGVAPMSFTPYGGDLLVGAEDQHEVFALTSTVTATNPTLDVFTPIATLDFTSGIEGPDGIEVIPQSPCAVTVGGTPEAWFSSTYGTKSVSALPASDFRTYGGDVLVQSENFSVPATSTLPSVTLLKPGTTGVSTTTFAKGLAQQEGATFEQCPGGTAGAKTIGFWRNRNGNAVLAGNASSAWPVTLGTTGTGGFGTTVTNVTESNAILSGTACGSKHSSFTFFSCTTGLGTGLQERTFGDLVAQTLALSYNVELSPTFAGTVFTGCNTTSITGVTPLTGLDGLGVTSSVTTVLTVADQMIATSAPTGATTQTAAGEMTALLGECINTE